MHHWTSDQREKKNPWSRKPKRGEWWTNRELLHRMLYRSLEMKRITNAQCEFLTAEHRVTSALFLLLKIGDRLATPLGRPAAAGNNTLFKVCSSLHWRCYKNFTLMMSSNYCQIPVTFDDYIQTFHMKAVLMPCDSFYNCKERNYQLNF